jgi:hypothetical protein
MVMIRVGAVLAAVAVLVGCVETSTLVTVNTDGSGTIALREHFSPQMAQMMESMSAAMEGMAQGIGAAMTAGAGATPPVEKDGASKGPSVAGAPKSDFIEQCIANSAEGFGPGVKLTRSEKRVNANGWKGYSAEYAFSDITQLQIPKKQNSSTGGGEMSMGCGPSTAYRFEFVKGDTSTLRLVPEKPATNAIAGDAGSGAPAENARVSGHKGSGAMVGQAGDAAAASMGGAMEAQMQQQALAMMKGARMAFFVRVNGTVTETNARFKSAQHAGVFTIFDANIDEIMKDKDGAKLLSAGDQASSAKMCTMSIPGLKCEDPAKTLTISFR